LHTGAAPDQRSDKPSGGPANSRRPETREERQQRTRAPSAAPVKGDDNSAMYLYFRRHGFSHPAALGVVAGKVSEGGSVAAKNPTSTAYGMGQWTKSSGRQAKFQEVMHRPLQGSTREQQWAFLLWEMRNTHKSAGDKIRQAKTTKEASDVYIDKMMIPGPAGAAGDKRRASGYLDNQAYLDLAKAQRSIQTSIVQNKQRTHVTNNHANHTTVNVKSTDPKGAAREISSMQRRHAVAQADRGVAS
jgi:hypothetical protein